VSDHQQEEINVHRLIPITACLTLLMSLSTTGQAIAAITSVESVGSAQHFLDSAGSLHLGNGQFFLRLSTTRKAENFVVTPQVLLHAREAILIVQVSSTRCRVAVVSGSATIKNIRERHIICLEEGSVYETCSKNSDSGAGADGIRLPGAKESCEKNIEFDEIADRNTRLPAYDTSKSRTDLYVLSSESLRASRFATMLSDVDDKRTAAASTRQQPNNKVQGEARKPQPGGEIISPPTIVSYDVGATFARKFHMPPQMVHHFPPSGFMQEEASSPAFVADNEQRTR
jgi:hypothetical protein